MVAGAGRSERFRFFFFFLGRPRQKRVRSKFEGEAHILEDTMKNFRQVINQNVGKKNKKNVNFATNISIKSSQTFFEVL